MQELVIKKQLITKIMKIVYCTDTICHPGGIQTVTMVKANALASIPDNQVWIIVTEKITTPMIELSDVHLVYLDINYYEDDWKGYRYRIMGLFVKRRWHKTRMQAILNEIKPDIVVSTGTSEKYFLPTLKIFSCPVFIREIHFEKNYRKRAALQWMDKLMASVSNVYDYGYRIKKYHKIIVLTKEDKERNWKGWKNVVVIPNPITRSDYVFSDCGSKKAIAAGRLVPQKNFKSLIRVWSRVVELHPDWILEIWGDGVQEEMLLGMIKNLRLKEKVFLKGFTSDLLHEMETASIFLLSSEFEGFPLVLIEAMSVGLPVVSYACPTGPRDIIEDGKNGFLIQPNDEEEFANKVCRLIEDTELRVKMGKNALRTSENYQMEKIIDMWMDLFHSLRDK